MTRLIVCKTCKQIVPDETDCANNHKKVAEVANDKSYAKGYRDCKAAMKAEIDNFRFHDLRHTCAAWLVQSGIPMRNVADFMRHRDMNTTMLYAHLAPEDKSQTAAALEYDGSMTPASNVMKAPAISRK